MVGDILDDFSIAPATGGDTLSLFDRLTSAAGDDADARELTDDALGTLEEEWNRLLGPKAAVEHADTVLSERKEAYNAQRERMLNAMRLQGTRQFRGSSGGLASIATEYTTKVEDPARFIEWVKETHPELLSVNAQTRNSFIRKQYRDKGIPPNGSGRKHSVPTDANVTGHLWWCHPVLPFRSRLHQARAKLG